MSSPVVPLGPLRHACHGCGACCTGHSVRLVGAEVAHITAVAERLGVEDPVTAGPRGAILAFVDQRCPFLDEARRCRIHAELGAAAKPAVCRQYPLRSIVAEDGQRVAVDPGCGSNWAVWQAGPELSATDLLPAPPRPASSQERRVERSLLELLAPGDDPAPLSRVVAGLARRPMDDAGLAAFATRAGRVVGRMGLARLLDRHAPTLRPWLAPVAAAGVPAPPHWVHLAPDQQRFVVELARRSVFLRSGSVRPMGVGLALGTVVGALACAWADPTPAVFGPAVSAWTRLLRLPPAWMALYSDPKAVQRLAKGR